VTVKKGVGLTVFVARLRILMFADAPDPCSAIKSRFGSFEGAVA
jgi:hypothetical protein